MATNASFDAKTGGLEVADTYSAQISGKTVLITGVSPGGIGEATARAFARGGASLIIATGRSKSRVEDLTKKIHAEYPSTKFRNLVLDLASLKDVRRAANEILDDSSIDKIDILVTNAGSQFGNAERELTVDGIETHFGANHLGHFFLVKLLLPRLRAAAKVNPPGATRVISVSSEATSFSPVRFSDWNFDCDKELPDDEKPNWSVLYQYFKMAETSKFDPYVAYGQSKTANALLAVQLNKLFSEEGIYSFSIHPGGVRSTAGINALENAPEDQKATFEQILWKSIDQGSSTTLVAASDPELSPEKGVWLADNKFAEPAEWAVDEKKAERLWKLSEDIIAEKLGH
ncbi:retinol dehydrogenase 12 [Corynespora cassiicola Philippines]|uniref:Retinol dehydrogenase 12 n=1 Tax=Corynespora cassiicola Philippines TaxID=1448308 RepID=A0A2T2P8C0_CORCC|nr:retinol dehydrogenase 12 [Corynespora cassiicola Philippines]